MNIPFKKVIRAYANKIVKIRDKFFDEINLNINKWSNLKFTDQEYNLLITNIKKKITGNDINKANFKSEISLFCLIIILEMNHLKIRWFTVCF